MKILVVYYSLSGVTAHAAGEIAQRLNAGTEEIVDQKKRNGVIGYAGACKDAMFKKTTEIKQPRHNPGEFDLVIIGTPCWAFTMTPAIRAYLSRCKEQLPEVAFICTQGGNGAERTFKAMEELCGKAPKATLVLIDKDVKGEKCADAYDRFAADIAGATEQ